MSLYDRWAPRQETVTLLTYLSVFFILPMILSWKGFAFAFGTIIFIIGVQPHINKLSEGGHRLQFAIRTKRIDKEFGVNIRLSNKKWANRLVGWFMLIVIFAILPVVGWMLQRQGVVFAERIESQNEAVMSGLNSMLTWAREIAPDYVPKGDVAGVFGGLFTQILGDIKKLMLTISGALFKATTVVLKDWFKLIISVILLGVLIGNWKKEVKNFRNLFEEGISHPVLRVKVMRGLELYQESLSILIIGFIEVGLTLSFYYMLAMILLPLNLSFGAVILFGLIFGFITAVWKVGGIATKIIAPLFMILNFQPGFGWFGFEIGSIGLFPDLAIKAAFMFVVAFIGGALEAYNYTPEKVGEKLGLTKMEMVMTILIWAIGAGFFGMIWGVLLMLVYQVLTVMKNDEELKTRVAALDSNEQAVKAA